MRVSQRATVVMPKIKLKFNAVGLSQRVASCPFRQFFLAPDVKLSGILLHQLLLRKITSNDNNEMKFLSGEQVLRFGLLVFALIIGLNFDQYPNLVEITKMSSSGRLGETYMNDDVHPKLSDLEDAFLSCGDVEDCWKPSLCCLVEGLLLIDEPTSKVNLDFLSFIEDEDFFFFFNILGDLTHITSLWLS